MDRYFKTRKDSGTGKKLSDLFERKEYFDGQLDNLCKEYKIYATIRPQLNLCGIIGVDFRSLPDKRLWRKRENMYVPRKRAIDKDSKNDLFILNARWDSLRDISIPRFDLDKILGGTSPFYQAGISWKNKDWFMFFIEDETVKSYNIPSDCIEITNIEYSELMKDEA